MKIRLWFVLAVGFALASAAVPVLAHHSFAAEFDRAKPVTVTGTVTKVEWANPHARFYVDVKDANGKVNNWDFELSSPNDLMRRGWSRHSLKPGDAVRVSGWGAKAALYLGNVSSVTLADGKKIFTVLATENEGTR